MNNNNFFKGFGLAAIGVLIANLVFWGLLIWFILFLLQQFGVI